MRIFSQTLKKWLTAYQKFSNTLSWKTCDTHASFEINQMERTLKSSVEEKFKVGFKHTNY